MWVFLNNAMISVVQHSTQPEVLHVRARVRGDLRLLFPDAKVTETIGVGRDYAFRCDISRDELQAVLAAQVDQIDYVNFKSSIPADPAGTKRHSWYLDVWVASVRAQKAFAPSRQPGLLSAGMRSAMLRINYGVNRRRPGGKSKRDIEHKNGKLEVLGYAEADWDTDDEDKGNEVHSAIRAAIVAANQGWAITGYAVIRKQREQP